MKQAFETYEGVAAFLLDRFREPFGLERVEGKRDVVGHRSGTTYRIDGKGICIDGEGFVIVECRRYTVSRQKQEHLAALAYRILDTGASGGILVSPLGFQEGAKKIATAEGVKEVQLNAESTTTDYVLKFLDKVMVGASIREGAKLGDRWEAKVTPAPRKAGDGD